MAKSKVVHVHHLGGIDVGYQEAYPYDPHKPTVILINSFMTSAELYKSQFQNERLTNAANLIAIELLGHGQTRTAQENWTYWDTAVMNLQALETLGIKKFFVLGTSQGGWITVRMALLAPDCVQGIIPLGTSMDYESERSRELGCTDLVTPLDGLIDAWTTASETPDFKIPQDVANFLVNSGFGENASDETRAFWTEATIRVYAGDEGRRRARMSAINLRDRDGLHGRLFDIKCPVLWMHGTSDSVYSIANAQEEIKLFVNSSDAKLVIIEGGQHFLSFSKPKEVDEKLLEFVAKHISL